MSQRAHRLGIVGIIAMMFGFGCQQPQGDRIVQNLPDPYVTPRPNPRVPPPRNSSRWQSLRNGRLDQIASASDANKAPPRSSASGDGSWMPVGGISNRWHCIVIHHSADDKSTPQGMADWHVRGRGWDELGYHFVIGNGVRFPDGQVFVGSRWPKQKTGAHCKVPDNYYNEHGIGICLIGNFDHHPPTARQMESLTRLCNFLSQQCGIPPSKIFTHGGVTHKTECPGRNFSVAAVRQRVARSAINASSN